MFTHRIVSTLIHPIQSSPQTYNACHLYGTILKKFRIRTALYSTCIKDDELQKQTYKSSKSLPEDETVKVAQQFINTDSQDYSGSLSHSERIVKSIDIVKESSFKELEKLFPTPQQELNHFYTLVNLELQKSNIASSTRIEHLGQKSLWTYTLNVSWPETASFTEKASTKRLAQKRAALRCLYWLREMGKIQNGRPVIYTDRQIKNMINMPIDISTPPEFVDRIKYMVDKFDTDIKHILTERENWENVEVAYNSWMYNQGAVSQEKQSYYNMVLKEKLMNRSFPHLDLPIFKHKEKILDILEKNQILLIKGDTACGKTTQVPQFIMDKYTEENRGAECNIIVSQPRRISAMSLAERVAVERGERIGDVVGYHVRLEAHLPSYNHGITFCTNGILLRTLQFNPHLEGISHVILDEAHERSTETDMLLTLLKDTLKHNKRLKLIVMSASIHTQLFQSYYNCPVVEVPGALYPVEMNFLDDMENSNIIHCRNNDSLNGEPRVDYRRILQLLTWICQKKPPGGILCFLPGWADIVYMEKLLNENNVPCLILLLHSKMSTSVQQEIFKPKPRNRHTIILSTDIAETGITVSDIKYVVDSAIRKQNMWDVETRILCMQNQWISQANITQRKGRAGRDQAGESYHFITREKYNQLPTYPLSEILCTCLEAAVLDSKKYASEMAQDFFKKMVEPPDESAIEDAVSSLKKLGALDYQENLTALGKRMVYIPAQPRMSKAMIYSAVFNCVNPIVTIASIYSSDETIFSNMLRDKLAIRNTKKMYHETSDHIALCNIYDDWENEKEYNLSSIKFWCEDMGVIHGKMNTMQKISELYKKSLKQCNMLNNSNDSNAVSSNCNRYSHQAELIVGILFAATNYLIRQRDFAFRNRQLTTSKSGLRDRDGTNLIISGESVNYNRKSWPHPFLTYLRRMYNNENRMCTVRDTSIISPLSVLLFSRDALTIDGNAEAKLGDEGETISVTLDNNKHLKFRGDKETMVLLFEIRQILWLLVDYILQRQGYNSEHDTNLKVVTEYKNQLLYVITNMLNQCSKDIDTRQD